MFDGTMTWAPFVEQTIAMVRDHQHTYKRGPGYFTDEDGNTIERCVIPARARGVPVRKDMPFCMQKFTTSGYQFGVHAAQFI